MRSIESESNYSESNKGKDKKKPPQLEEANDTGDEHVELPSIKVIKKKRKRKKRKNILSSFKNNEVNTFHFKLIFFIFIFKFNYVS